MRSKVIREYDELLNRVSRVHFIGIGGSGMCPLVDILRGDGKIITGSDVDDNSDTVKRLRSFGIKVAIGQRAENIGDAELVVYSAAIAKDNPELVAALNSDSSTRPSLLAASSLSSRATAEQAKATAWFARRANSLIRSSR